MNILIIGGNGYVGSALYEHLKPNHNITNVDLNWFPSYIPALIKDYRDLTTEFIDQFNAVILLAGHSSVNMCKQDLYSAYANNVTNFVSLLQKIKTQKFIYASSASVYGVTPLDNISETATDFKPLNPYDMTKLHIDQIAEHSGVEYYGLRFGTVNGIAPHWRNDVMINAMTYNALQHQCVKLFNGDVKRSILGINDLLRAFDAILEGDDHRGIYNVASFTATAKKIATTVGSIVGVRVEQSDPTPNTNEKLANKTYDFGMDTSKFQNTYNFEFTETIESITKKLVSNEGRCITSDRNQEKYYR